MERPGYSRIHTTVLLKEAIESLVTEPAGLYLDCTLGGGGHTSFLLESFPRARVVAFEWDKRVYNETVPKLEEKFGERFTPIWGNFAHVRKIFRELKIGRVAGVLADLGTARIHYTRGFGFSFNDPESLDMRMSQAHGKVTAYDVVNKFPYEILSEIIRDYGEERLWKRITKAIIRAREEKFIETSKELAEIIDRAVGAIYEKRDKTVQIHPATRTFQAIRIYLNRELENLNALLKAVPYVVAEGGRVAIITFHSLEDRMVKRAFAGEIPGLRPVNRKPILPTREEIMDNPASRSAKLRVAEVITSI